MQSPGVDYDEDADVVGPFFTEYGDQPTPRPATPSAGSSADPGGAASAGSTPFAAQATAVILDEPIPPGPEPVAGPTQSAGERPPGARPWDGAPPEPPAEPPVIDADLLDDAVLDAELIGGPPYVDEADPDQAYGDEAYVDEAYVDEALVDEGIVGDTDDTFVDEVLLDELLMNGPPVDEPLVEEAVLHEPPVKPATPPLVTPFIPAPRTEPPVEALVGEVVIDTSRVGEAARGIGMMLIVSDLGISLRFYRDILGLQAVDVTDRTAELTFGGSRLLLCLVADMSPVNRRVEHLHLDVPDVEAAYHDLRAKGVEFPHPPRVITTRADGSELLAATFRDPDGHAVALTQWRDRADDLI